MHEDCLLQEHSQQKQQCWHSSNSFSSCNPVEACTVVPPFTCLRLTPSLPVPESAESNKTSGADLCGSSSVLNEQLGCRTPPQSEDLVAYS